MHAHTMVTLWYIAYIESTILSDFITVFSGLVDHCLGRRRSRRQANWRSIPLAAGQCHIYLIYMTRLASFPVLYIPNFYISR